MSAAVQSYEDALSSALAYQSELDAIVSGEAPADQPGAGGAFAEYQFEPARYITDKLGWQAWDGSDEHPGQVQILDAYVRALQQQHERQKYERDQEYDEDTWQPGQQILNRIRVESGDNQGKSKLVSGLVWHFFSCFEHSVVYTFAPSAKHLRRVLWKYIKQDSTGKSLPGIVLDDCTLKDPSNADHFAVGIATDNTKGLGRERIQGQHPPYILIVIDEGPGVADYVYDALDNITSGGICVIIELGNPTNTICRFHEEGSKPDCINFRLDALYHPNVIADREIIPGAATRRFVLNKISECEVVEKHSTDDYTFELPWQLGVIYKPTHEVLTHVRGIPPANISDRNLIPAGRFEAAKDRKASDDNPTKARVGIDVARFGKDYGTMYIRHNGRVWRAVQFHELNSIHYYQKIRQILLELPQSIKSLHVRIDAGGGENSGGVIDNLSIDEELKIRFPDYQILTCHFGGNPKNEAAYRNAITEWMADVAETLKSISVSSPPQQLQSDLCKREYDYTNWKGKQVKVVEDKASFRKRLHRSPDDGDGFVLAVAGDHLFKKAEFSTHEFLR